MTVPELIDTKYDIAGNGKQIHEILLLNPEFQGS